MNDYEFLTAITDFGDMIHNDSLLDACHPEVKRVLKNLCEDFAEIQAEAHRREIEIEEQWEADNPRA